MSFAASRVLPGGAMYDPLRAMGPRDRERAGATLRAAGPAAAAAARRRGECGIAAGIDAMHEAHCEHVGAEPAEVQNCLQQPLKLAQLRSSVSRALQSGTLAAFNLSTYKPGGEGKEFEAEPGAGLSEQMLEQLLLHYLPHTPPSVEVVPYPVLDGCGTGKKERSCMEFDDDILWAVQAWTDGLVAILASEPGLEGLFLLFTGAQMSRVARADHKPTVVTKALLADDPLIRRGLADACWGGEGKEAVIVATYFNTDNEIREWHYPGSGMSLFTQLAEAAGQLCFCRGDTSIALVCHAAHVAAEAGLRIQLRPGTYNQDDDMYSVCDPGALPSTYDMMRLGSCPSVFLRACEKGGEKGGAAVALDLVDPSNIKDEEIRARFLELVENDEGRAFLSAIGEKGRAIDWSEEKAAAHDGKSKWAVSGEKGGAIDWSEEKAAAHDGKSKWAVSGQHTGKTRRQGKDSQREAAIRLLEEKQEWTTPGDLAAEMKARDMLATYTQSLCSSVHTRLRRIAEQPDGEIVMCTGPVRFGLREWLERGLPVTQPATARGSAKRQIKKPVSLLGYVSGEEVEEYDVGKGKAPSAPALQQQAGGGTAPAARKRKAPAAPALQQQAGGGTAPAARKRKAPARRASAAAAVAAAGRAAREEQPLRSFARQLPETQ
ncbi:dmX 2 isoform A [Micractinium conductrix]|uniref:DmX 2 isoform A n=1 Tax=Micractinium conductrix TaxID=554055 RepID=A0A2P6V2K0_9CHLO|nr:dmX 2 isoform A [Micractinium conductrix]|eukprot:PSC68319.1 dmX 2 isoform A [Micractinium conductrix]